MNYERTQSAPYYWLLTLIGAGMLFAAYLMPVSGVRLFLLAMSGVMFVLALSFRQLTLRDDGDWLAIRFGPLPLFQRKVVYDNIQTVNRGRTSLWDGWGIHYSLSGHIVWNIWGFDCVDVTFHKGRKLRIGTDDPEGLEAFLKQRMHQTVPQ